ncbi:hypothetical protein [Gordonia oryzae]|uniref:hypothetical protein n=1 Tax=Gordonia oryzae TaxID=2487349 RepID=UPI001620F95E|nr:hypothetical protein [Gordonia oryzae]
MLLLPAELDTVPRRGKVVLRQKSQSTPELPQCEHTDDREDPRERRAARIGAAGLVLRWRPGGSAEELEPRRRKLP